MRLGPTPAILALSLFVLFSAMAPPASAKSTPRLISISRLERGDTLRIEYSSSGCFSSTRADVWILGSDPTRARVLLWKSGPAHVDASAPTARRTVRLTREDRRGLDRLLAFYRSNRSSGCTTVDHVTLTLTHRGQKTRSESFVDGSCQASGATGVVTLGDLVRLRT